MKELIDTDAQLRRCLALYDIRYAEVYDEVYDHCREAICAKLDEDGEKRNFLLVFTDVLYGDFGGQKGLEQLEQQRLMLLSNTLKRGYNTQLRAVFGNATLLYLFAGALALSLLLHGAGLSRYWFFALFAIGAVGPLLYLSYWTFKNRKRVKRSTTKRPSLVMSVVGGQASLLMLPMSFSNILLSSKLLTVQRMEGIYVWIGIPGFCLLATLALALLAATVKTSQVDYEQLIAKYEIEQGTNNRA